MSERKQQNWPVPLRVRIRPTSEHAQSEREHTTIPTEPSNGGHSIRSLHAPDREAVDAAASLAHVFQESHRSSQPADCEAVGAPAPLQAALQSSLPHPHMLNLPTETVPQQHTHQIKELIRLGNMLRAELGLGEVLQQIVSSISTCTGFRIASINLIDEESGYLVAVALTGSSEENERLVLERRISVEQILRVMRPEYRASHSYFVSHEHFSEFADIPKAVNKPVDDYQPGSWHPEEALIVPLFSPRKKKLLGFLALDDPVDGRIPTVESIEMVELFANQAALAIDNARIFQEREAERVALEEAIVLLRQNLEQVQRGDLRVRVQSSHEKLQPVVDAINVMIEEISGILGSVQMVTQAVDEHAQDVQRNTELLVRDTSQQERQVHSISRVIDEMANTMYQVSERAEKISQVAVESMDVTLEGQNKVDRATDGMRQVRESTLQSARIMKRLGESGQEINDTVLAITDLTTRMNLLALNAAIEAVRVGESGQGFAAIAQEIRTLAVHSTEAARKVATRIRTIQQETATVSQSVEQNISQVVMQTELVTQTGVALEAISVVTEQMAGLVQGICSAADSQAQGAQLVVHSVEEISRMTSDITHHMRDMQQSLAHLVELTNSLRSRMSIFRISE